MSAKNKKGGGRSGGSGPKRPYSTIDLKATEISPEEKAKTKPPEFGSAASTQPRKDQRADAKAAAPTTSTASSTSGSATSGTTASAASGGHKSTSGSSSSGSDRSGGNVRSSGRYRSGSSVPQMGKSAGQTGASAKAGDAKTAAAAARTEKSAQTGKPGPAGQSGAKTATAAAAAAAAKTPPPAKQKSGGGFISHMSAAIIGSLLALFGAKYVDQYVDIPGLSLSGSPARAPTGDDMSVRLAALEKALASDSTAARSADATPAAAANTKALRDQLAATQARLQKLEALSTSIAALQDTQTNLQSQTAALQKSISETGKATPALTGRLAQLEQTLTALGAAANKDPDNAGRIPQLAAISGRVNDLETSLKTRLGALRKDLVQAIDQRASTMSEVSQSAKSGTQRLDRDVAALRSNTAKLDQRLIELNAGSKQMRENLRVVQEKTGTLKVALETLSGDLQAQVKQAAKPSDISAAIAPITQKIGSLEQNLQSVVQSETARKSNAKRIVLALELGNLKRALDRGQDFAPELKEVKRVSAGKLDLSALEALSGSGVPTLRELQKEFGTLSYKLIDATTTRENASVMDRLLNGARSMVRVRQVNHSRDDNSAEAVVGRMDGALKDGRLGDVLTEAAKLPAKAQAPAADWLRKVKARQSVDQALATIEDKLKSSLGGTATDERG